jgi:hypothetical protein
MTPYNHAVFKKTSKKSVVSSSEIITITSRNIVPTRIQGRLLVESLQQGGGVTGA